jgi:hypothetical protein
MSDFTWPNSQTYQVIFLTIFWGSTFQTLAIKYFIAIIATYIAITATT